MVLELYATYIRDGKQLKYRKIKCNVKTKARKGEYCTKREERDNASRSRRCCTVTDCLWCYSNSWSWNQFFARTITCCCCSDFDSLRLICLLVLFLLPVHIFSSRLLVKQQTRSVYLSYMGLLEYLTPFSTILCFSTNNFKNQQSIHFSWKLVKK